MGSDRLYTEKEISEILKRAGKVQAAQSEKVTMGLSLEEIQHIAEEVGLEPDIVASVANEIDIEPEQEEEGFISSLLIPTKIDIEQIIPGELSEEEWPEIVSMIERKVGKSGASSQIGRMMEWKSDGNHSIHKFSMIPGDNQTKVIYQSTFTNLVLSWTLPILINVAVWAFIAAMIAFSWSGIPIGLVITFLTYLAILSGFKKFIKRKKKSVKSMFSKVNTLVKRKKATSKKANDREGQGRIIIPEKGSETMDDSNAERKKVR